MAGRSAIARYFGILVSDEVALVVLSCRLHPLQRAEQGRRYDLAWYSRI
ncbi:MAG: hypothetical protein JO320_01345 [Alphaproteobacteria bacterium]|nr:hypothetical protein [Alphaproteobacteria bacterium]MBV9373702.1 hypothetical protein [Alphaproteobacteria bacterium]MBV9814338.1 hypothetical protein [Alphaproteobacteria bacterium]